MDPNGARSASSDWTMGASAGAGDLWGNAVPPDEFLAAFAE